MMEKAYSLFLCVLLISVLFLPSTAAGTGRALLETAETESEGGYHEGYVVSKMSVTGTHSKSVSSRTGVSSPSKPAPIRKSTPEGHGGYDESKLRVIGSHPKLRSPDTAGDVYAAFLLDVKGTEEVEANW